LRSGHSNILSSPAGKAQSQGNMQGGSVSHGLPASKITENKVPSMRGIPFFGRFLGERKMKNQGNYKLMIIFSILYVMALGINP
jgi:hypothetical protein